MLLFVLMFGFASPADEINLSSGLTLKGAGLAAHGYDLVSIFDGNPILGNAAFSVNYEGATYRFASQKNLETFKVEPQKFLPQFGGYCAFGVSVGAKFDGDPLVYKIVDGKLYFNLNPEIQKEWSKDTRGNITKAEKQWHAIKFKKPNELK